MGEIKKTITSIFLVPTLKIGREGLLNNGFINGYCCDPKREVSYENVVYLLFRPKNMDKFKDFLDNEYIRTKNVIEDYDYEDGFVVVVYQLNPDFKKDYELIRQGKYSKTSVKFQKLFPETTKLYKGGVLKEEHSLQFRIFNKTEDLREYWEEKLAVNFKHEFEVWDGWEEEKETLDLEKLKELV